MAPGERMSGQLTCMSADQSVVATKCLTCGNGFAYSEEVCACRQCGGYHHARCWDDSRGCSHNAGAAAAYAYGPLRLRQEAERRSAGARTCGVLSLIFFVAPWVLALLVIPSLPSHGLADSLRKLEFLGVLILAFVIPSLVLGIVAIVRGSGAKRLLEQFPLDPTVLDRQARRWSTSPLGLLEHFPLEPTVLAMRGRATAGMVMGWVVVGFFAVGLLIGIANSR